MKQQTLRRCNICKQEKGLSKFHKNKLKKLGHRYDCKQCRNKTRSERRKRDNTKYIEYENRPDVKLKTFDRVLKRQYGITLEIFAQMLEEQNGVCKLCLKPERHKNKTKLSVDHSHVTGKVRGLLCHRCNVILGLLNEDVIVVQNILNYIGDSK